MTQVGEQQRWRTRGREETIGRGARVGDWGREFFFLLFLLFCVRILLVIYVVAIVGVV